jgi:DNA-directed RNA polymerase specialized sigma24 family protein
MTRVDEFTSFYEATSATCLRAVYAMCGDRQVAQDATVDAYRRAWRDWSKIRGRDPLAYVRSEAWKLTAVSRSTHPLRRRHEEDADTALLEALHDLPVDDRRLIVLLTLGDTDLDQASREVGVTPEEGIEVVTTALDGLERRLGLSLEELETRLKALGTVTGRLEMPAADAVRSAARRGRRRNTVLLVAASVVAVLAGGLVATDGDALATRAELPYREKIGAERPDIVLEARQITAKNLLSARQVSRLDPELRWSADGTDENLQNTTPYATCPPERYADPDPLRVFVRTFTGSGDADDRVAEAIEVSRDDTAASRAYEKTLGWYAGCTHPRVQLVGSFVVKRPFGDFQILRLRSHRSPQKVFTVGLAHSGRVTSTVVHERTGSSGPSIDDFAMTLNASVQRVCRDSGGRCTDDFEVAPALPPRTESSGAFLDTVDLPPVADIDEVWSGTRPLKPRSNPAATQCGDADFRRKGLEETSSRVFVIPDAVGVPAEFGVTETVGTYEEAGQAKALASAVAREIAACPDENQSAKLSQEREIRGDGFTGRSWRLSLEVSDGERQVIRTGVVRRGSAVAQVTMTPVGDYDVDRRAWEALVERAGERLAYAETD